MQLSRAFRMPVFGPDPIERTFHIVTEGPVVTSADIYGEGVMHFPSEAAASSEAFARSRRLDGVRRTGFYVHRIKETEGRVYITMEIGEARLAAGRATAEQSKAYWDLPECRQGAPLCERRYPTIS